MRIFVTGGAGFIGSHYVRGLLDGDALDVSVTVLDKMTYAGNAANLPDAHPRLTVLRGDVCDGQLLLEILPGHDAVVHFAAESHVDRSLMSGTPFVTTNVLGTQTLLEACRQTGVERIVHVSTDEVYGSVSQGSRAEDALLLPNSPYAASKAASDLIARAYWRSHDLNISITRCSNNYGPYQLVEKAIPLFVTNLLDGLEVPLYGDGYQVREWLHVTDHCRALDLVLHQGRAGEIYNISAGVELTNRELVSRLLELCGAGWDRVRHVTDRKAHDQRYSVDTTKIQEELGFTAQVPFDEGLAGVVAWYRDNRAWWEPLRKHRVGLTGAR
ncbi:dTDP-glucose 4,6-dehydratase [Nonomuraea polychroma]|uniref:dTDP-glucose 4,6-dehydratase n=1 Tax=Nonomuraea polychroma TaxID=46176 RepID=A0A438LZH4_9ACTN|nr:dTDP-glucose 4,6-dehydratase [Nonomuraea polychroma]RVX38757.1 dTDP-glucose 4,6-dehydratase [Nonomuraea polychroma]